jgi:MoaA/NifB/PqqE/SkfB family radical SAM enzyme
MANILEAGHEGNPVGFVWSLIDRCQFSCSYCFATDFNQQRSLERGIHLNSHRLVLHKLARFNFDFNINLQGGEPTLHPDLPDIIASLEANPHCRKISLVTNLAASIDSYLEYDKPASKLEIHASYHPEHHAKMTKKFIDMHRSVEHILFFTEVVLYPKQQYYQQLQDFMDTLEANNVYYGVNIVRDNEFWDGVYDPDFYETFQPYIDRDASTKYSRPVHHVTDTGIELLRETDIITQNISYTGFQCQQQLHNINIDGSITKMCNRERIPLLPKESDFRKYITCPMDEPCRCADMFHYKKYKVTHD